MGRRLIRSRGEAGDGVVGPGRAGLAAAMGAWSVVVGHILGQDRPQMPLADGEHRVGDLGPGGEHERFRVSAGPHRQRQPVWMIGIGAWCS